MGLNLIWAIWKINDRISSCVWGRNLRCAVLENWQIQNIWRNILGRSATQSVNAELFFATIMNSWQMNRSDGNEIPVFTGLPAPEFMQSVLVLSARLKNKKYCIEEFDEQHVCQGIMIGIMTGIMLGIMLRILLRVLIDRKGFWSSAEFQEPGRKSWIIWTFSTEIGLMRDLWYMRPLPDSGKLRMTLPDKPKSWNQKYFKLDGD